MTAIETKKNKLKEEGRKIFREDDGILIYRSQYGDNRNLNCLVLDNKRNPIACRHLAYAVLEMGMKDYHFKLNSRKNIRKIPSLLNNRYDEDRYRIRHTRKSYHFFPITEFGKQLEGFTRQLTAPTSDDSDANDDSSSLKSESHWYVYSCNHAMAVSIKLKSDNTVVVKFYDPNKTTSHVRALCRSINDLSRLTLKDFIPTTGWYEDYFKNNKNMTFTSSEKADNDTPNVTINENVKLDSPLAERCVLFHYAIRLGQTEVVKAYCDAIINSKLDDDQKVTLLLAKVKTGTPGFYWALQDGHAETVKAYCDAVLDSELDDEKKVTLLLAKQKAGVPGFNLTLQQGHTEAVQLYIESVLNSNLPNDKKTELLAATDKDGNSILAVALEDGHTKTVTAYISGVINSELGHEVVQKLIDKMQRLQTITNGSQEEKMRLLQRQIHHFTTVCTYLNSLKLSNVNYSSSDSLELYKDNLIDNIKRNAITLLENYISVRNTQNTTIHDFVPFSSYKKENKIRSAATLLRRLFSLNNGNTSSSSTPDDIKIVTNKRLGKITQALVNASIFRSLVPQQPNQNKPSRVLVI